jgi:peptidoglycan/LPS O-acetylase OafA/YrhL
MGLGASAAAGLASVANIYFWKTSGYFGAAAIQKPLLHIWSLSVEEQFYLAWPALIYLGYQYKQEKRLLWVLATIAIIGTLLAEDALWHAPYAAFYLTPFRAAEFSLGAICVLLPTAAPPRALKECAALLGLALICFSIASFTENTPFPGLHSLVPGCRRGSADLSWQRYGNEPGAFLPGSDACRKDFLFALPGALADRRLRTASYG